MARLRWLRRSVENLVAGAGMRTRWLVVNVVFGMLVGGSVVLSEMARQLTGSKKQFRNVLNRLSRGLGSEQVHLGRVYRRYLRQAGAWTRKGYDAIALDMSEIVKPYGCKMENLCHVRDASETRRGRHHIENGWWLVEAVATSLRDHRVLPLARRVWSSTHEQFVSQNHEVMQAIHEVLPYVSRAALWVLDRGFDAARFFTSFNRLGMKWVIRQRGDRHVILPHVPHTMPMAELAELIDAPHVARPWVSRDNKLVREEVRFGSCTVDLTDGDRYILVVVRFSDSAKPMMLLSNVRVRRTEDAGRIVVAYFRR